MESPDSEARAPLACHICELRDLPDLRKERHGRHAMPSGTLPEVYISRKLNWPPRGLLLDPGVMAGANRVLAYTKPEPPRGRRHETERLSLASPPRRSP